MTPLLLTLLWTAGQTNEYAQDFHHDFRGQPLPPTLALMPWKHTALRIDKDGGRITLAKDRKDLRQFGVISTFPVKGDFEITAAYDIAHADAPAEGYGVGVTLFIQKADPSKDGSGIYRLVKPKGVQQIHWDCANTPPGQTRDYSTHRVPCDATILRMRITRKQSTLSYWWAPGLEGDDFREIGAAEFGVEDVKSVTLNATTGGKPAELDARFLDLRIRSSDKSLAMPDSPKPAVERPRRLWWLLLIAVSVLVFVTLLMWRLRQRRAQDEGQS